MEIRTSTMMTGIRGTINSYSTADLINMTAWFAASKGEEYPGGRKNSNFYTP